MLETTTAREPRGKPFEVGRLLPNLDLTQCNGHQRRLAGLVAGDPTVLHFYRGWWCPKEDGYWFWGRPTLVDPGL